MYFFFYYFTEFYMQQWDYVTAMSHTTVSMRWSLHMAYNLLKKIQNAVSKLVIINKLYAVYTPQYVVH